MLLHLSKRELVEVSLLCIFTIALRLIPIFPDRFPFMFDHAKDSLLIMQMGTKFKPSLIGAVTSIPGVYYGPLWYYLALPLNIVLGYQPIASVLTVILLSAVSVVIAYKYLGKLAAVWLAVSFGLITTQTSAWSPYLTPFVTLPTVIILLQLKRKQKISTKQLVLLGLLVSTCFHFQPAFAVVLTPLVMIVLGLLRIKMSIKQCIIGMLAFVILFTPHLVFELRHDFHQTKQVISFFQHYGEEAHAVQPNKPGFQRVVEIGEYWLDSAGKAVSPIEVSFVWVGVGVIAIVLVSINKLFKEEKIIFGVLLIGTYLLYLVLPAKQYYVVGILPVWIVLMSRLATLRLKKYATYLIILLASFAMVQLFKNVSHHKVLAQSESFMLQPKIVAIQKIYELSEGKSFASYQFVPEIYDYTYQHLFRSFMRRGYQAPMQYSYAPGEYLYLEQVVPDLLPSQNILVKPAPPPDYVFLIVEKPVYDWAYDEWWNRATDNLEIEEKYPINAAITVYKTKMKE